jgi:hypothetical protein
VSSARPLEISTCPPYQQGADSPVITEVDGVHAKLRSLDTVLDALDPLQADRKVRMSPQPLQVLPVQLWVDEAADGPAYPASFGILGDLAA